MNSLKLFWTFNKKKLHLDKNNIKSLSSEREGKEMGIKHCSEVILDSVRPSKFLLYLLNHKMTKVRYHLTYELIKIIFCLILFGEKSFCFKIKNFRLAKFVKLLRPPFFGYKKAKTIKRR